jgi:ribosomal protein S18 acetylase RimI-like enzyme
MTGDAGIDWRPIERADAAAWSATLTEIQHADRDWEFLTEQDLLDEFGDPDHDFPRGSVAAFAGGTMAAFGTVTVRSAADPVHDMRYWGSVHPNWRQRGLGRRLLDWAEDAAVRLHREHFPGRPLSLSGSCLERNAAAAALYAARGYRPVRWFQAMTRDLETPLPDAPLAPDVQLIPFAPEVSEDARLIRNEAFADHWGSTETPARAWAHYLEAGTFRPGFSFLARAGGTPAGFVLSHEYEAYNEVIGRRDLHIALIGTRRAARGRGIASALLVRALAAGREDGFSSGSLVVDADSPTGAVGLYERAGFTVMHTSVTQAKSLLP